MKNVVLYVRVSTDEQADKGFSLRDQEQKLINYCKTHQHNVVAVYREDHSAKTFNRPEFKKLLGYCIKNKRLVDELLFIKWDRFSRNTLETYNMINKFDQMGVILNAIEQPLDLSIPEQHMMLSVYVTMPQVENHRRSLNVMAGMRRAFREGRYVASPPRGYSMGRDNHGKPILTPNDDAPFIKQAFELLATGLHSQKQVLSILSKKGFQLSKSSVGRIIRNPLYHGEVHLKAYRDEKEMVVDGIHEPLITKSLYLKVLNIVDGKKKQQGKTHKSINPLYPLKGFILCPSCGNPLLASASKGRSNYYAYYHCSKPCNTRYKKEDVEYWFNSFLKGISLNSEVQKVFYKMIEQRFKSQVKNFLIGPKHFEKVTGLKEKLIKLQDLYIEGCIEQADYIQAKNRYELQLMELKEIEVLCIKKKEVLQVYQKGLKKLEDFDCQFNESGIDQKRRLLGSMFPQKFQFEKNKVRTADINPILLRIASVNKGFKENKKRDKSKKYDLSLQVLKAGLEPARP